MRFFNIRLLMSLVLALSTPVHAQVQDVVNGSITNGFFSNKNYVKNPNCSLNAKASDFAKTATGDVTRITGANALEGGTACQITGTASGDKLGFTTNTLERRLYGQNCEARFTYWNDASKWKVYVQQGTTKITSDLQLQNLSLGTDQSRDVSLYFPCGVSTSGATQLVFEATAATPGNVPIGKVFIGSATGLGVVSNDSDWTPYTPTINGVGTPTGVSFWYKKKGDTISIRGNFATGTTTATPLSFTLPPGLTVDTTKVAGGNVFGYLYINNSTANQFKKVPLISFNGAGNVVSATRDEYAVGASWVSGVNANVILGSAESESVTLDNLPVQGWVTQTAVRQDTTALQPAGEIMTFAGASCPTGWLKADGTAVSRSAFAQLFARLGTAHGSGDGSTTFNLPDYRGVFLRGLMDIANVTGSGTAASNNATFTAHGYTKTGTKVRLASGTLSGLTTATDYFVIVVDANTLAFATTRANALAGTKIAITGANSAVIQQFEDPDAASRLAATVGGNTGATVGSYQTDDFKSHTHDFDASVNPYYMLRSSGTGTFGWTSGALPQTSTSTGVLARGGNETRPINSAVTYCVRAYDATQVSPLLVGSVSNSSQGAERIERANIGNGSQSSCTGSPCTIENQSGSWLSSVTRGSTGNYVLNFTAGMFSGKPTCTCSATSPGTAPRTCTIAQDSTTSLANVVVHNSGTAADGWFQVICMGPR